MKENGFISILTTFVYPDSRRVTLSDYIGR